MALKWLYTPQEGECWLYTMERVGRAKIKTGMSTIQEQCRKVGQERIRIRSANQNYLSETTYLYTQHQGFASWAPFGCTEGVLAHGWRVSSGS